LSYYFKIYLYFRFTFDWFHRHRKRFRCGKPVRIIVSGGYSAVVINVAKQERHGAKPAKARASGTYLKSEDTGQCMLHSSQAVNLGSIPSLSQTKRLNNLVFTAKETFKYHVTLRGEGRAVQTIRVLSFVGRGWPNSHTTFIVAEKA